MNLKQKVEKTLKDHPKTRDDDAVLTMFIWYLYHQDKLFLKDDIWCVELQKIKELPREDACKRYRAKFNENDKYLSEDIRVLKRRKQLDKVWKKDLGYEVRTY